MDNDLVIDVFSVCLEREVRRPVMASVCERQMWEKSLDSLSGDRRLACRNVDGRLYGGGMQMRYRYRIEPTPAQQAS